MSYFRWRDARFPLAPSEVLGVAPDASLPDIKRAFRDKAKMCHPDVVSRAAKSTATANEEFRNLRTAYDHMTRIRKREEWAQKQRMTSRYQNSGWLLRKIERGPPYVSMRTNLSIRATIIATLMACAAHDYFGQSQAPR
jgi:curved DNA-binding protein CbpA